MQLSKNLAKLFRDVHYGGNWTTSSLKQHLSDVTWKEAIQKIDSLNTIIILTNHINYYVFEVTKVLQGGPLLAKDELSFNHPPINSDEDWQQILTKAWADADLFASLVEQLPDEKLWEVFVDPKYGNYYRNIAGIIEHTHYHLGQIVLIKKIIRGK